MNTPSSPVPNSGYLARSGAAALLGIHGLLVLFQAASGPEGPTGAGRGEVRVAALHFVPTVAVAHGLRRARPRSWWVALSLVALGLFFLLPIAMGSEPSGFTTTLPRASLPRPLGRNPLPRPAQRAPRPP